MAIQAGVGLSTSGDSQHAGYEACTRAMEHGGITKPDAVIVFGSIAFSQEKIIEGVNNASGGATLFGCSSAGEIVGDSPKTKTVAVMAIQSDTAKFVSGIGIGASDGFSAGKQVAQAVQAAAGGPLKAMLITPDPLTMNGGDVIRGVTEVLGAGVPIIGGAAGDDFQFEKTHQYVNERPYAGSVGGLGIMGEGFAVGLGVRHGWMPIGLPMHVTKSQGSILYEVDGRPAVSIYEEYFEETAEDLRKQPIAQTAITYPLGMKVEGREEYLIRDPLTVGEDGSITCAAEIPEGATIRLMIGSRDRAIDAAKTAAQHMMDDLQKQNATPKCVLVFNCIAREKLYGGRAQEEIVAIQEIVGNTVPLLGFYTYGEIAPLDGGVAEGGFGASQFFNETIVLLGIGE